MPRSGDLRRTKPASMMMPPSSASPHLELVLKAQRDVTKVAALKADERPLAVIKPAT